MAGNPDAGRPRFIAGAVGALLIIGLLWAFPPFRVRTIKPVSTPAGVPSGSSAFDPVAAAEKIWQSGLIPAAGRAVELTTLAPAIRADPVKAQADFGRGLGSGPRYYLVRGHGRVISRDRNHVQVEMAGPTVATVVALRIGPIFGNAVRDGGAQLDVNAFPGLAEFNAVAAALNALVEKNVIPTLRDKIQDGAELDFAGIAEAPESPAGPTAPLLVLIPVHAAPRP